MDKLYVFQYLTDGAGNYILDGDGNTIVNATSEYPVDMAAAGVASYRGRPRRVNSFSILANDDLSDWTLIINQYDLVGRYPSQAVAIGALVGCFIHADADQDGLELMISDMIQNGTGQIDEDGDNLMSQRISNGTFTGTLRNFNKDTFTGTTNSMQQDALVVGNTVETLLLNDPLQTISVPARYGASFAFEVRTDKPSPNAILLPAEVIGAIDVNISFPAGTPIVGQPLTATATVTGYDSRIPIKYQWTWKENPSGANTMVKTETTTSSTSSYTPTGTANYRAEVELLYALDDTTTGVSDSETSGNAFQPFEWVQGPEILNLAQDQYYVFPTAPADYIGNSPVNFAYEWMKNGSPFGTDSASQILTDPGNYTVDVTGSNTVNSQTYTDTILSRNSITIAEPSADVQFIRLFTALGPSGTDVTDNPPANTQLYAYAYSDAAGTQLITDDVTFTYSSSGTYWEDFSVAQSEIDANPGGVVDFTGRYFRPEIAVDEEIDVPVNTTITGGTFTAGVQLTSWSDEGGGIFSANIPTAVVDGSHGDELKGYEYLVDHNAIFDYTKPTTAEGGTDPVLARHGKGPTDYTFEHARSYNSSWWDEASGVEAMVRVDDWENVTSTVLTSPGYTTSATYPWTDDADPPVSYRGYIRGFKLSGTAKAEFETATASGDITGYVVQFKAGANRIDYGKVGSYDTNTGELLFTEESETPYLGYSPFTVMGSVSMISQDREYAISLDENKVYYRPSSGESPTNVFIVTGTKIGGGIFLCETGDTGDITTFNNVKMYGTGAQDVPIGYGIMMAGGVSTTRVRLESCEMMYAQSCLQAAGCDAIETDGSGTGAEFVNNVFARFTGIGISTGEGAEIRGNVAMYGEQRSFVMTGPEATYHGTSGSTDYVPNKIIFRDNYVFLPCANHGQGISLYLGSYLNADVSHNIIRCMRGAISFQPRLEFGGHNPNPVSGTSELNIVDNLFPYDLEIDRSPDAGQATLAFNSGDDSYLTSPQNHTCTVARNLQYIPSSLYDPAQLGGQDAWLNIQSMRINVFPYFNANVNLVNNMGYPFTATIDTNPNCTQGGNAFVGTQLAGAGNPSVYTVEDLGYFESYLTNADCLVELTPQTVPVPEDSAVEAVGGGASGYRWDAYPSLSDLDSLTLNWADSYAQTSTAVPVAVSSPGTASTVVDERDTKPAPPGSTADWKIDGFVLWPLDEDPNFQYFLGDLANQYNYPNVTVSNPDYTFPTNTKNLEIRNGNLTVRFWVPGFADGPTWVADNQNASIEVVIGGTTFVKTVAECGTTGTSGQQVRLELLGTDGTVLDTAYANGDAASMSITEAALADDWDTYQQGAGTIDPINTSDKTITYDASYPNQTPATAAKLVNVGGAYPFKYALTTSFMSPADKASMSSYAAMYAQAGEFNGRGNSEGWYVFGPGVDNFPGISSGIDFDTPVAWPTGANDGSGLLDVNTSTEKNKIVWLSNYTGTTGNGGTDSWTAPSFS